MAQRIGAEPQAVRSVGEQQLALLDRQHRDRCLQAFEHGGEALVRGRELVADPLGLGDVGHRGHPSGLLATRIDQGRDVHPGVEQCAVLSHHLDLDAAGRTAPLQFLLQQPGVLVYAFIRPVGVGWQAADQLVFGETRHGAERRVDIADPSFGVHRAHTGEHRVFHRSAEVGFLHQRALDLRAPPHVSPGTQQHPQREHRQRHDHPEQRVADQPNRTSVTAAAQRQSIGGRRQRYIVQDGGALAGQPRHWQHTAGDDGFMLVDHGDRMAARYLDRHEMPHQHVD